MTQRLSRRAQEAPSRERFRDATLGALAVVAVAATAGCGSDETAAASGGSRIDSQDLGQRMVDAREATGGLGECAPKIGDLQFTSAPQGACMYSEDGESSGPMYSITTYAASEPWGMAREADPSNASFWESADVSGEFGEGAVQVVQKSGIPNCSLVLYGLSAESGERWRIDILPFSEDCADAKQLALDTAATFGVD